nr:uncharacterized protein LOC111920750 [Ipomoea batatas]GMD32054.1 uncharacterized protein LOC111920750 [Ipomoea batatas]GMD35241.1 uncharacterized protein LOC111920750 [Ipomoea batatas]
MTLPLWFESWMFLVNYMIGKHIRLSFQLLKCLMRRTMGLMSVLGTSSKLQ